MNLKVQEIINRYKLDEYTAGLVQEAVQSFAEWIKHYGPVTWCSDSERAIEAGSNYVWPQSESNSESEYIYNGFEESELDDDPAPYGFYLATKSCEEEPYSMFVTTDLWIDCKICFKPDFTPSDCAQCDGQGCILLSIPDLLEENVEEI